MPALLETAHPVKPCPVSNRARSGVRTALRPLPATLPWPPTQRVAAHRASAPAAPLPTEQGVGNGVQQPLALRFLLPICPQPATTSSPGRRHATRSTPSNIALLVGPDESTNRTDTTVLPIYPLPLRPTSAAQLSPGWTSSFVRGIVEVISGQRSANQLLPTITTEVLDYLRLAPLAPSPTERTAQRSAQVRSLHITRPTPNAAEVCATVCIGTRYTAIALRLDNLEGRWRCTNLALG